MVVCSCGEAFLVVRVVGRVVVGCCDPVGAASPKDFDASLTRMLDALTRQWTEATLIAGLHKMMGVPNSFRLNAPWPPFRSLLSGRVTGTTLVLTRVALHSVRQWG